MRQEVVAEAEHAFGNLFHRLHYFAQKLQGQGVEGAAAVEGALSELEDLIRLVLDYTSPLKIQARELDPAAVLGSLGSAFAGAEMSLPDAVGTATVWADAGQLSEAFRLMRQGLGDGDGGSPELSVGVDDGEGVRWLRIDGFHGGRSAISRGRGLVVWALAQKLIEAQGGLLSAEGEEGGVRWSVRLPLPQ